MTTQIDRRDFLRMVGTGMAAMGLPAWLRAGESTANRPNILFLLTDDQRWDALGCMGNRILKTPHLDELARDGVLFTHACVTTSICCCSRASILTGQTISRRVHLPDP